MPNNSSLSRPRPNRWPLVAGLIFTAAIVAAALVFTRPLPPRKVVMATGPEGGTFDLLGQRYAAIFARNGVKLELRTTNGAVENIALLNDRGTDVGITLAQSGVTDTTESPDLVSLGTLFYEPFWFFSAIGPLKSTRDMEGKRIGLGRPGSATYKLGRNVLAAIGLDLDSMHLLTMSAAESAEALQSGKLDFAGMAERWRSATVQQLLSDPHIVPVSWIRADAQVALRPYLSKLILPRGVANLAMDLPRKDVTLVASKVSLIVREDLHPALQHLLLDAAAQIHGSPGVFNKAGEFPAAEPIDLPLSSIARDYYRNGQPLLQRYLPFWLAAYASRLLVLLIPILGVAYPLFRIAPAIYDWSMRRRILRLYGELKFLEAELESGSPDDVDAVSEQLDRLERHADRMHVPITFSQMLYILKQHIALVRQRVLKQNAESGV